MATNIYVGKRLSFDGQLCTVRYNGEVKGTKGEWLGVEWDDPTRGKHSGQHGDIRYFQCLSNHPTAGSFIRPTRKPDTPRSFVEALKAKYASEDFEDPDVQIVFVTQEGDNKKKKDPLAKLNQPIRISGKEVEEVGFDKIRKQLAQLSELKIVILDGLCMWRPEVRLKERGETNSMWVGGLTDVKDACPKAIELDLSRNLFEEWREVASICEQLEKLRSLRVDGNRFRDTALTEAERTHCLKVFASIKILKMEENFLPWEQLVNITHMFPSLTTFVASSNLYSSLTLHTLNPTITDLSLEDNLFSSISSLLPLTKLPNLQRLILKSNRIAKIHDLDTPLPIFSSTITELDLSFNEIAIWPFIDTLAIVFPGLTSLRVSHNPLYTSLQDPNGRALTAEDGYMLTLARLGNLKMLNYSPITDKERLNAESYYLSLIVREVQYAAESQEEQILDSHPRYKWLCEEYGEPIVRRSANAVNPNSLAARLVRIKLYQKAAFSTQEDMDRTSEVWEVEIPMSCTVYTLLGMVAKKLAVQPLKCRLIWETGDWMPARQVVDDIRNVDWESDSEEEEDHEIRGEGRVMREVEIVPGTRSIGTWIEGTEATVRVELR